MALDAFVYCNCLKEGKAKPLPFDKKLLITDKLGWADIDLPQGEEKSRLFDQLVQWEADSCEHPDRYYLMEQVSSLSGLTLFRRAIEAIDVKAYPILFNKIPVTDRGYLAIQDTPLALEELERFKLKIAQGNHRMALLKDLQGSELFRVDAEAGGYITMGQDGVIFLREDGLFILDRESNRVKFQSSHFTQSSLNAPSKHGVTQEVYTQFKDVESGQSFRCNLPLLGEVSGQVTPQELVVQSETSQIKDFDYITTPLEKLLTVSIETGNPVKWT